MGFNVFKLSIICYIVGIFFISNYHRSMDKSVRVWDLEVMMDSI